MSMSSDRGERPRRELVPEYGGDRDQRTCRLVERGELTEHDATNTGRKGVGVAVPCGLRDGADVEGVATAGVAHPVEQRLAGLFAQRHGQAARRLPRSESDATSTRGASRASSARSVRLASSVDRSVAIRSSGQPVAVVAMWAKACSDDASAHCRSSMTTTVGVARATADTADASWSSTTKPSAGVARLASEEGRDPGPMSARTSVSRACEPRSSASIDRSTCTQGQNAGATSPCQHRPQCTADAVCVRVRGQLRRQAGLSDPGRPGHDDRPTGSALGPFERRRQLEELALPTDEAVRDHARSLPLAAVRARPYDRTAQPYASRAGHPRGETHEEIHRRKSAVAASAFCFGIGAASAATPVVQGCVGSTLSPLASTSVQAVGPGGFGQGISSFAQNSFTPVLAPRSRGYRPVSLPTPSCRTPATTDSCSSSSRISVAAGPIEVRAALLHLSRNTKRSVLSRTRAAVWPVERPRAQRAARARRHDYWWESRRRGRVVRGPRRHECRRGPAPTCTARIQTNDGSVP